MSDKTTHAAIVETVRTLTNAQKFSQAIVVIEANPSLVPTREEKMLFASAYAGDCGLPFAGVFTSLASAAGSPMQFAMSAFTSTLINPGQCYKAQLLLESIGVVAARSTTEMSRFFNRLCKSGHILKKQSRQ